MELEGIIFDKDGTLLDAQRTWGRAINDVLDAVDVAPGDIPAVRECLGMNPDGEPVLRPDAALLWMGNGDIAAQLERFDPGGLIMSALPGAVLRYLTPMPGAASTLRSLKSSGLRLAIATNDDESSTREQLAALGWTDLFEVVIGHDSGWGPKPEPHGIIAVIRALSVDRVAVVGDTAADVAAARAAGVPCVGIVDDDGHLEGADRYIGALDELLSPEFWHALA